MEQLRRPQSPSSQTDGIDEVALIIEEEPEIPLAQIPKMDADDQVAE